MPEYTGQTIGTILGDNDVSFTSDPPVFPLGGEGHVLVVTDDGTCDGVVEEVYIFDTDCNKWVNTTVPDEITDFVLPPVVTYPTPSTANVALTYNQEGGTQQVINIPIAFPTPASAITAFDVAFTGTSPNLTLTVSGTYLDDNGNSVPFTDSAPITLGENKDFVQYTGNNTVPTGTPPDGVDTRVLANGDRYDWNGSAWVLVPAAVLPVYITCDGTPLTVTDRIATAPTGAYASGYTVNQEDANGCATRADTYYNFARRSHTFGESLMSNDAQGYGSSVTGGLRNTTATAASYSHIGGGYDHSITVGTASTIGGGRNNDITAGSYNGIAFGYNQNITAGNYNTIGGGDGNDIKAGSYNTIVGGSAIDFEAGTGSYNVAGGVNTTFNGGNYSTAFGNNHIIDGGVAGFTAGLQNRIRAGSYVSQFGYSHDNVTGTSTTQGGYNHTNTSGSYNSQLGYSHIIDVGQSITQGGQSNRNRAGNYNSQFGFSHDNQAGSGNFQAGYDHLIVNSTYTSQTGFRQRADAGNYHTMHGTNNTIVAGSYNTTIGNSHIVTAGTGHSVFGWDNTVDGGNYSFMGGVTSRHRSGNYNAVLGYSHDVSGTGNMLFGYDNTTNATYSVSIGRSLNNTTTDGIMIANTFQRLGFFGATPITRQTANTLPQLLTALKAYGLIL